ncbi:MAG: hypothetical protein Q8N03_15620 [Ignavibacteria bacterium]|nr:hypothetical protein [Ignavibacteria bacterium]
MKKIFSILSFLAFISILALFQSCKEETTAPQNKAPEILNISGNPNTSSSNRLPYGGLITFAVTATDPDKDPLTFIWECSGGSFVDGQGTSSAKWQSPNVQTEASYAISVTASDGALTSKKTITAYVAAAIPGLNVYPSNLNFGATIDTIAIKIFNTGTGFIDWGIQNLSNWMSVSKSSGTIANPSDTSVSSSL